MQHKKNKNKIQFENVKKKFLLGEKFINNSLDFKHGGEKKFPNVRNREEKHFIFHVWKENIDDFFQVLHKKKRKWRIFAPSVLKCEEKIIIYETEWKYFFLIWGKDRKFPLFNHSF